MHVNVPQLTAYVHAVNLTHAYSEHLYGMLREFFIPFVGKKITKINNSLLTKIENSLPKFPAEEDWPDFSKYEASLMTWYAGNKNSVAWKVKVCCLVPTKDYAINIYYDHTLYIGDISQNVLKNVDPKETLDLRADYTVEEIVSKIKAYSAAKEAADLARTACYPFYDFI